MGRQSSKVVVGVSDVWPLRRSPVGTRRAWRQREKLQALLRGQRGPRWWEVAPAALAVLLAVGLPAAGLGWLWVDLGGWAAALAAAGLACGVTAAVRRRRAVVASRRPPRGPLTVDQLDGATDRRVRAFVGRLLVRDGWAVRGVRANDAGAVHLVGERNGRRLGCAVERGADGEAAGPAAALRPIGPAGNDPAPLLLVVSTGAFARTRVIWAARNGVRLVDRVLLERWAAGDRLEDLLDLGRTD